MFKLSRRIRGWVLVLLAACAVFLASANLQVGEARPLLAIAPPLRTAKTFAVLGASTVTNTGDTILNGDLGVSPGTSITGFPPGSITGTTHTNDAVAQQAQADTTAAYNALTSQACDLDLTGQDLGGLALTPRVYCFDTSAQLTGALTLNGSATDVWVFKIGSTLTTATGASVILAGGASPCNVFWQIGSSATLGTTTAFKGNILALASIDLGTGASLSGLALAQTGAVTLDTNSVDATVCAGVPSVVGLSKSFSPATITAGGVSTLTITLLLFGGGIGGLATWLGWQLRKARSKSK